MKRFTSAEQAQRFFPVDDQVANLFYRPANSNAADCRQSRTQAFTVWAAVTGIEVGSRSITPVRRFAFSSLNWRCPRRYPKEPLLTDCILVLSSLLDTFLVY
jgi:hypothetical protein